MQFPSSKQEVTETDPSIKNSPNFDLSSTEVEENIKQSSTDTQAVTLVVDSTIVDIFDNDNKNEISDHFDNDKMDLYEQSTLLTSSTSNMPSSSPQLNNSTRSTTNIQPSDRSAKRKKKISALLMD